MNVKQDKAEECKIIRVSLWSINKRTIFKFRNECQNEGIDVIDTFLGKTDTIFKLKVMQGKRIFLPCKGEVDIWPHKLTW